LIGFPGFFFFFSTTMGKQKKGKVAARSLATPTSGPTIDEVRRLTSLASYDIGQNDIIKPESW
jgi:hypothetical protein